MDPVQKQRRLADHSHEVQLGIRLAETIVRAGAEDEPVLELLLGIARDPTVWVVRFRVRIGFRVVQGWVEGGHDHGACGNVNSCQTNSIGL